MPSPFAERAINDALTFGKAILKFIAPNDVGLTGSHQCGFYLPRCGWKLFSPHPPEIGDNRKSFPKITWQTGQETHSVVTWYGKEKSEYRLTQFGRDFPLRDPDVVGNLLVIVPKSTDEFLAYVLDYEEDIEEVLHALGVEVLEKHGAVYDSDNLLTDEVASPQIDKFIRDYVAGLAQFPGTSEMSSVTQKAVAECVKGFAKWNVDKKLLELVRREYELFKIAERRLCQSQIFRLFSTVDDFLKTAQSILQRRRSRAGRSLENHFEFLLKDAGIPFDVRPPLYGEPDIVIPSSGSGFKADQLVMVGLKTTCKDRWRQVVHEAPEIPHKFILTLQNGISERQLKQIENTGIKLIVPKDLHSKYPRSFHSKLWTVEKFLRVMFRYTQMQCRR